MSSTSKDLLILILIGLISAALFLVNYVLVGKTRWVH